MQNNFVKIDKKIITATTLQKINDHTNILKIRFLHADANKGKPHPGAQTKINGKKRVEGVQ